MVRNITSTTKFKNLTLSVNGLVLQFEKRKGLWNQFMLGDNILVASIVEKNALKLNEVFAKGNWKGDDSKNVKGGKTPD